MIDRLKRRLLGSEPALPVRDEVRQRLDAFLTAGAECDALAWETRFEDYGEAGQWFLAAESTLQLEAIHGTLGLLRDRARKVRSDLGGERAWREQSALTALAGRLLKRKHAYRDTDLVALLDACCGDRYGMPVRAVVRAVETSRPGGVDPELKESLVKLRSSLGEMTDSDGRKLADRIDALATSRASAGLQIERVDAWTTQMLAELEAMDAAQRGAWESLLAHCATARGSKPARKWLAEAAKRIEALGPDHFRPVAIRVLDAAGTKAAQPVRALSVFVPDEVDGYHMEEGDVDASRVSDRFSDCLRGFVWATIPAESKAMIAAVGDAAERCFKKLPGHGPLAPKIGNACLVALSDAASLAAVGQLSRLRSRVKHASIHRQIQSALDRVAKRHGISQEELEERAAPTAGLTDVGVYKQSIGDYTLQIELVGARQIETRWRKPDGKLQKSVPSSLKETHADELREVKRRVAELKKLAPAQSHRVERLLLLPRSIPLRDWRERYLDHVLVGTLARRLIWSFGDADQRREGIWRDGALVDLSGAPLELTDETPVQLWHPIDSEPETVRAWRDWLHDHGVTQPFKQAHRELYLVTDAERGTESYSNRFAAHILKQHQFSALCQDRGWRYSLMGSFDSDNTPFRDVPELGLRIEYWVNFGEGEESGSGIYLYIATDQVRFYRLSEDGPLRIEDVPPRAFSELMRDVDLFVGVASVANDPNWMDGGQEGRYRDYWYEQAFGALSESAKTRHAVLTRLVPQLKIADRCSLEERALVVRGNLRTYRIHLGSGNIQMSPNNEYLCIVPGRKSGDSRTGVALPFEGDGTLSIILSKAFLLAEDDKIKDASIQSQLRNH